MTMIGIIGGSGLDDPTLLKEPRDIPVDTPWGPLTSPLRAGVIGGKEVRLLARHGRQHADPPTQVNFRANIHALKAQGCDCIIAATAVGSLRQEIDRGHLVILDQFIDFTRFRKNTFIEHFEPHLPAHPAMPDPFHPALRKVLIDCCKRQGVPHHDKGTIVTIEGPRFSTRAESHMFRAWGADVINMTSATEAALANEAGIPYAAVAMSTDYDCWKDDEPPASWEHIIATLNQNVDNFLKVLLAAIDTVDAALFA
ncbi:MAG: S-methyl-5'-thioadenosine phosphorylase [Desulfovibrionaceae bacterium]